MFLLYPGTYFYIILAFLFLVDQVIVTASQLPSKLNKVEIIHDPTIHVLMGNKPRKRDKSATLENNDDFLFSFSAFNTYIQLQLFPNFDLFHPDAQIILFNHTKITETERMIPDEYFVFKGHIKNQPHNWARIIFRQDITLTNSPSSYPIFEGAFMFDSDIYHIKTSKNYHLSKRTDDPEVNTTKMIIYRDSDQVTNHFEKRIFQVNNKIDSICAMEEMAYNRRMAGTHTAPILPAIINTSLSSLWEKRTDVSFFNTLIESSSNMDIIATQGCPTARKIAYMGAAADCSYVLSYGSIRYAKLQIINDWNVASAVYERTFNVSLGLIYLQISVPECPSSTTTHLNNRKKSVMAWNQACSSHYTINDRLSDFSLWRGNKGDDGAALWHLMTKCSTGVKVGIAWLGQLCETQVSQQVEDDGTFEWVSGTGVSSITRDEWKVVAHEIGHGFGAIHDCTAKMCPCHGECGCCPLSNTVCSAGEAYIMNPTSNVTTNDFSPCSISDICNTLPNIGYCLKSPDLRVGGTFSLCGNGILEPGEECDSGLIDSECCYARTCKLKPNAICDDYSHQCCLKCAIASKETVCRPSVSECDRTEYCTGKSSQCPIDEYSEDGTSCANGTMKCASGICTSRDQQCMARGLRQNISEQCSFQQDSCLISCSDPKEPNNCLMLSGIFLDGTECGLAGFCKGGVCIGTGPLNTIKAWTAKNKSIAIPIYIFSSLGILLILGWIIWFIRRRYKRKNKMLLFTTTSEKDKNSRPNSFSLGFENNSKIADRHLSIVKNSSTTAVINMNNNDLLQQNQQIATTNNNNNININNNNTTLMFGSFLAKNDDNIDSDDGIELDHFSLPKKKDNIWTSSLK
ncbi:Metallo-peptidase family M12-domain-containing protein [Cokeromyces recurvatus]|uniref:Metallo-peptidase family M12-domain-containing protein n=1 Tax=Cokeromyces recurvatus TaxID=90255 RepID=UPI00221EC0A3|nr:Metallo-peptidase family M12-domain-containing protein [Cokeromyces recurvatus]KAI7902272.1 Metallo-peptidase family M12-domain-containing protein [Cokeromyces recurvatus]